MSEINLKAWNRLIFNKNEITTEVPSSQENLRHWIAIYPNTGKHINKNIPPHEFSVWDFELDSQQMQEYEGDEDLIMVNEKRYYLKNEQELYKLLENLGVDPDLFEAPWLNDYPF